LETITSESEGKQKEDVVGGGLVELVKGRFEERVL
jgi:hypothetical protein